MTNPNLTTVTLTRTESDDTRTLGEMRVTDRDRVCYTLELPWRDNLQDVSCIPPGTYVVTPHYSPRHEECFKVWNVPGRKDVLIHIGNDTEDTLGCILPGLDQTSKMVLNSKLAMEKLQGMFPDTAFYLTITDVVRG